ncbi:MAG: hypothetical protein AAGF11_14140 [Myxococcota bacterium]
MASPAGALASPSGGLTSPAGALASTSGFLTSAAGAFAAGSAFLPLSASAFLPLSSAAFLASGLSQPVRDAVVARHREMNNVEIRFVMVDLTGWCLHHALPRGPCRHGRPTVSS